jgi:hypothetical protein
MRRRTRIARTAAVALALGAFIAPTAFAQQDLRSPDTRDAAAAAVNTQDLRSPDTRDIAIGHVAPVDVSVPSHPAPAVRSHHDNPWPTVGVAMLVLALVAGLTATFVLVRRPNGAVVAALADGTRDWRRGVGL